MNENLKFALEMVKKHFGKKEKMLVTRIFSFSQSVFKRLLPWGP